MSKIEKFVEVTEPARLSDMDLLIQVLEVQGGFVAKKIVKSERALFLSTMNEIILKVKSSYDLNSAIFRVEAFRAEMLQKKPFFIRAFSNPYPTNKFAFDLTDDALKSFRIRFQDGGSKMFVGLLEEKFKGNFVAVSPKTKTRKQ